MGLAPDGNGEREFWIEKDFLQGFYKRNWMDKYKAVYSVSEVLKSPSVVFRDLKREGMEAGIAMRESLRMPTREPGQNSRRRPA